MFIFISKKKQLFLHAVLNLALAFEMSSGSGLITWGTQENTKRDEDIEGRFSSVCSQLELL